MNSPVPDTVLKAFGVVAERPQPVAGGQGGTFRTGDLAIKRCEDERQTEWLCEVMEAVAENGFRVARPVRSSNGRFTCNGWCVSRWVEGTTVIAGHWDEAMTALQAFHRAVRDVPWSPTLRLGGNPYNRAEASAWGDSPGDLHIGPTAERLRSLRRPVSLPSQLIQGDPSEGNLLFSPGQSPAIIDFAPCWRPSDYGLAVLIADAVAWSGAPADLLATVTSRPEMDQLLIRAVLFRLLVGFHFRGGIPGAERRAEAYAPVIRAIESWPRTSEFTAFQQSRQSRDKLDES